MTANAEGAHVPPSSNTCTAARGRRCLLHLTDSAVWCWWTTDMHVVSSQRAEGT